MSIQEKNSIGRVAAYWSAHLDIPISADDVLTMARIAGLALEADKSDFGAMVAQTQEGPSTGENVGVNEYHKGAQA